MNKAPNICLDCRSVLNAGARCSGSKHRTVDTSTADGRTEWLNELWTQPRSPRKGRSGRSLSVAYKRRPEMLHQLPSQDLDPNSPKAWLARLRVLVLYTAATLIAFVSSLVPSDPGSWSDWRASAPIATRQRPPQLSGSKVVTGFVASASSLSEAIGSGESCAAWSARVFSDETRRWAAIVRYGSTRGLVVVTDGGRRYRIPAGRVRVLGAGERHSSSDQKIRALVGGLAEPKLRDDRATLPHDYIIETRVEVGQAVRLRGNFQLVGDSELTQKVSYRNPAPREFTATGEVEIEVA